MNELQILLDSEKSQELVRYGSVILTINDVSVVIRLHYTYKDFAKRWFG